MASAPQSPSGGQAANLAQQVAIGLSIVSILLCTIVGSGVMTLQEGTAQTVARPTDTPTALPIFPSTSTPTSTVMVVYTATYTPSPTATPGPTSTDTATPRPGETPVPPTETPTATAAPTATATPSCQPPYDWQLYTVQSGDTLIRLASRHGTTVSAIVQANCLQSEIIYRGQRLYLPPRYVMPTATPTRCVPYRPAGWVLYTVQSGDTLYGLALSRQTTLAQIQQVNCLSSYALYAGQQIYLPPASPTPTVTTEPTATVPVTPTETIEPTPTSTVPVTVTATATVEPTATPTATATATIEPTATVSPTVEATPTLTPLPTKTLEPTPTLTPLPTKTLEPTPTGQATATSTPVPTKTPTVEATATLTPLPTKTATPTATTESND
jgi:LysM repeat protein